MNPILDDSPAMAVFNGRLYVAFRSKDNTLYVSAVKVGADGYYNRIDTDNANGINGIKLQNNPAMAAFNGKLYIAFKANDESNKLYVTSSDDGMNFPKAKGYNDIRLQNSPAMAAFNGKLYIAFKSNDSMDKLYVTSSDDGTNFPEAKIKGTLQFTDSPAMATQSFIDTLHNVKFAVYGDMPYGVPYEGNDDDWLLRNHILPRLSESVNIPFVMHVGDIGRPGGTKTDKLYNSCTDAFRATTLTSWRVLNKPMFFTPGDNDWTDCSVEKLPKSDYKPLDELAKVKAQFFSAASNRDRANLKDFAQQDNYPENQMWSVDNILYITLHVVGSDNGFVEPTADDAEQRNVEARKREYATLVWILRAEEKMVLSSFSALVVTFHVDSFRGGSDNWECMSKNSNRYYRICGALKTAAITVKKPVLLVHGDTDAHCFRKYPMPEVPETSLWVLNAPGDYVLDADLVSFDKGNAVNPFSIVSLISGMSPSDKCVYSRRDGASRSTMAPLGTRRSRAVRP
ncbi:MAG TPA: hypothetical protein VKT76_13905 [Bradyrhizobium sp.]|nr:hypothetical protein [Bradyrhizobium sp.]